MSDRDATKEVQPKLTAREKQVVVEMRNGMWLLEQAWSRLYGLYHPDELWKSRRMPRSSVNRFVVSSLADKGIIRIGCPKGEFQNRYILVEATLDEQAGTAR